MVERLDLDATPSYSTPYRTDTPSYRNPYRTPYRVEYGETHIKAELRPY